MNKTLEQIINIMDEQVAPYNMYCRSLLDEKCAFGDIDLNLHNERTIAHFFDVQIQKRFEQMRKMYLIVSECSMNYLIAAERKEEANSKIKVKQNEDLRVYATKDHSRYVPDTVIVDFSDLQKQIHFIEYKVDNVFSICKLALDYLKYKYYSYGLGCCSNFIYVLFYTLPDGSIELRDQVMLNEVLEQDTDYSNRSIFVYYQNNKSAKTVIDDEVIPLIERAESVIESMVSCCHVKNMTTGSNMNTALADNVFYRNRGLLNPNVITADVIKRNYPTIVKLANNVVSEPNIAKYNTSGLYELMPHNFNEIVFDDKDCLVLKRYFNNQISRILEEETRSLPAMYNFSKKRSTWILILLQRLAINNHWNRIADDFKLNLSEDDKQRYQNQLERKYNGDMEKLNVLCLGLLYFIINLYKVIFDISESNEVIDFNNAYKNAENTNNVNLLARKIARKLDIKISRDFNILSNSSQEEFFQKIVSKLSE